MKTIYKYPLYITDVQKVTVPAAAHFLNVAIQNGELYIWALVNTDFEPKDRTIKIYGTGNPIDSPTGLYIGTAHNPNGLVWHVFEN